MGRERNTKYLELRYNNSPAEIWKRPKDVKSYRPVALTNILCKIFEKDEKQETGLVPGKGEENT